MNARSIREILGYERHVTHKIGPVMALSQNGIDLVVARTHAKKFNHRVKSTTALAFSSDFSIISSRQPTSCLARFATIISYSFIAVDEKARFQGLRCCKCNIGSRWVITDGGPFRPSEPDTLSFKRETVKMRHTHVDLWEGLLAQVSRVSVRHL